MTRWKSRKRAFVLSAVLFVSCVVGPGVGGPVQAASGDPMDLVPKDCLFCVRINNLDNALGQTDLFLTGLFPMGISMMAKMQLGQFLGSPQPQGLDTAGGFAVFAPIPGASDPTSIGILAPVSDYKAFVSGNANVSAADGQGISKIGPAGSPMLISREFGGYALISPVGNEQALADAVKPVAALSKDLDAAEGKRATTAPLWAYGNIQAAGKMFGPMIQMQLGQMKQMMAGAQEDNSQAAMAGNVMEMYSSLLNTLFTEAKYSSLALTPSGDKISLSLVTAGMPESKMAEALQGGATTSNAKLAGYLDNGACMNILGKDTPFLKKLNDMYVNEMLPKMMGGAISDAQMQEIRTMAKTATEALGGAVAMSMKAEAKNKPPFAIKYVAELKDAQKLDQLLEKAGEMMTSGPIAEFYKGMGMKMSFDIKSKAQTYKGVAIDAIRFNIEPVDPNAAEAQAIGAVYGDGLNIHMATTNGLLVYALAQNPEAAIRELIDAVKGGGSQVSSETQAAMKLIPGAEKADFFGTINALRLMQMGSGIAPVPLPIPEGDLPTQSNLAMASTVGDGKMTFDLAVPKQHVLEIMGVVMQMQQQNMQ